MRASQQEQTGGIGPNEVAANFQRIGWGPVHTNTQHDLGTDLFVQVRDDRLFDRGLFVGVQVKAGPSCFESPVYADDGSLLGWWYTERDARHFDDWVQHGLPHLLVLHDIDTRISYWVHVTAAAVQRTGQGAKILVPQDQTIDQEHLDQLLAVAATQKPVIALQGTAWTAGAKRIAPARRLRHALLVPRLIAPHANAGYGSPVEPEEAVALLVQGRLRDVRMFADQHASIPDLDGAARSKDWRWRFVAGLGRLVTTGDLSLLTAAVDDAPSPEARAAVSVVLACAYMDAERYDDALTLLLAGLDEFAPVDHAWVLTHRARVRSEIGDLTGARQDA